MSLDRSNSFSNDDLVKNIMNLRNIPNSKYFDLKLKFCYHTNKIEGSTITLSGLISMIKDGIVIDNPKLDDVFEALNSLKLFDYVLDTVDEPLSKHLIKSYHQLLKKGTKDDEMGLCGCFKKYPNQIIGTEFQTVEPYLVEEEMEKLIRLPVNSVRDISEFHYRFERIHPFQDGNGRVGRFLMFRQLLKINRFPIIISESNVANYRKSLNNVESLTEFISTCDEYKF